MAFCDERKRPLAKLGKRLRGWERGLLVALTGLFLCVQLGPLGDERSRWCVARGNPFVKEVALTFDDGPREWGMPELLAALESIDARGTFFLVGKFAERYGDITKSIAAAGHQIENHSYTHPRLYTLWVEKIIREAERCNEVMEALDIRAPRYLRPPGGGYNLKIYYAMRRMNMRLALWSLNTIDYHEGRTADEIARNVVKSAKPGSIILMHSGVPATVEALPAIASGLRERGFRFVTLHDMYNGGAI
jgi:peptidoglycan/xylan/chitin deacetylase (PgdA/CDA1 family)